MVAKELEKCNIDVAACARLDWPETTVIDQGYAFRSGKEESERREAGVGFAIKNSIAEQLEQDTEPINDSLMSMCLSQKSNSYATILSVYIK